jgi:hypothetical protein
MHGPSTRILFKDIGQVLTYHQQMLSTDPKCVERCKDDLRVWSEHVENYVRHIVPATNWFPQINEVFLLYTGGKLFHGITIFGFLFILVFLYLK